MKFIKVKNTDGRDVLVNLSKVSHFFQSGDNITTICFTTPDDYIKVPIKIEAFYQGINNIDDSANAWDFTKS